MRACRPQVPLVARQHRHAVHGGDAIVTWINRWLGSRNPWNALCRAGTGRGRNGPEARASSPSSIADSPALQSDRRLNRTSGRLPQARSWRSTADPRRARKGGDLPNPPPPSYRRKPVSIPGRIDKALSSSPEIPPLLHPLGRRHDPGSSLLRPSPKLGGGFGTCN